MLFLGTIIVNCGKATSAFNAFSFSKLVTVLLPDLKKKKITPLEESTDQEISNRKGISI